MTQWLILAATLIVWLITVAGPILALIIESLQGRSSGVEIRPPAELLMTSLAWAVGVAAASTVMGWIPGRLLASMLSHRQWTRAVPIAALLLVPTALPSYILFYAWWQSWPAETEVYQWVVMHGHMQMGRNVTLLLGLVCWSWPMVSLCVVGSASIRPATRDELLELDGVCAARRWFDRFRTDARGLVLGGLLVALATLANTTCFDLAEVFTFANELRAIEALGASPGELMRAAWPMLGVSLGATLLVWRMLAHRPSVAPNTSIRIGTPLISISAGAWIVSAVLPITLFVANLLQGHQSLVEVISTFDALYQGSAKQTLWVAMWSAALAALTGFSLIVAWNSPSPAVRGFATAAAMSWLFIAIVPGTLVGIGLRRVISATPVGDVVGSVFGPTFVLSLGYLAAFGFVAALLARWVVASEPSRIRDLRRLDGSSQLRSLVQTMRPRLVAGLIPTAVITFVLAVGEIPITAMINPPHRAGAGPMALWILNDMHYQRPQTVMIAAAGLLGLAFAAAAAVGTVMWFGRRTLILAPTAWTQGESRA